MEGVEEEFALFRDRWLDVATFPIASTGDAARRLLDQWAAILAVPVNGAGATARDDVVYTALVERLLV